MILSCVQRIASYPSIQIEERSGIPSLFTVCVCGGGGGGGGTVPLLSLHFTDQLNFIKYLTNNYSKFNTKWQATKYK